MRRVLILGAGKIGRCIANYLAEAGGYKVRVGDLDSRTFEYVNPLCETVVTPLGDQTRLDNAFMEQEVVISALYHEANVRVAETALKFGTSYFDLTEDVASTKEIIRIAAQARSGQLFVPQCGLAPGFVSIVAGHLAGQLDTVESIHLRVGALPQYPENRLKYNLTWSTDGLINEYSNPCDAIVDDKKIKTQPLDGVENFSIDGTQYEAFNTSGGLGNLCDTLGPNVRNLNYKTLRYPGHRDLMHFLLHDCRFSERRGDLKRLLEHTLPSTSQDVVVIYCTATGEKDGRYTTLADVRKIYSRDGWSAIQITTASSVCALVDLYFEPYFVGHGVVLGQDNIPLHKFLNNRFGKAYDQKPLAYLDAA